MRNWVEKLGVSGTQQNNLVLDGIQKHFVGTFALRDLSLNIARGEIAALPGEDGSGKSTLIKILGGIHKTDEGRERQIPALPCGVRRGARHLTPYPIPSILPERLDDRAIV